MIRLIRNLLAPRWMYGPLWTVRVDKQTGEVQRKYMRVSYGNLKDPRKRMVEVWEQVDGVTLGKLPNGTRRPLPPGERFWTAQSAV